jgi:hypothetical protein
VSSGITAAITMAVQAVFDINIEASIVVSINPNRMLLGLVPETLSVNPNKSASRRVFRHCFREKESA